MKLRYFNCLSCVSGKINVRDELYGINTYDAFKISTLESPGDAGENYDTPQSVKQVT